MMLLMVFLKILWLGARILKMIIRGILVHITGLTTLLIRGAAPYIMTSNIRALP